VIAQVMSIGTWDDIRRVEKARGVGARHASPLRGKDEPVTVLRALSRLISCSASWLAVCRAFRYRQSLKRRIVGPSAVASSLALRRNAFGAADMGHVSVGSSTDGSRAATPSRANSLMLRVSTMSPCRTAVAAMIRSGNATGC
jgi:hypothetical protein